MHFKGKLYYRTDFLENDTEFEVPYHGQVCEGRYFDFKVLAYI